MSLGAEIDLIVVLASRYFPHRLYARAFSLLYAAFLLGAAVSPVVFALLREPFGNYSVAFGCAALLLALAAILFASLKSFPNSARDEAAGMTAN
jgi:dipeptide/tripeptide permease